jgi:hypothetical protein
MAWSAIEEDEQKSLEIALLQHEKDNPVPVVKNVDNSKVEEGYRPIVAGADTTDDDSEVDSNAA